MAYKDGPPYSEDEDLHSPVVKSSRHKKHKSEFAALGAVGKGKGLPGETEESEDDDERGYFARVNGAGRESRPIREGNADRKSPEDLVTYPQDQGRRSLLEPHRYHEPAQRDSHFAATLPSRSYNQGPDEDNSDDDDSEMTGQVDDSRFSKDYQFTIASPDEEMHGKAVALFDFTRENENELPLVEGQVIWVSYRHGQGWLVAEDPKTGESGLVPEEYVRLLRDIEGGWTSLSGELNEKETSKDISLSPVADQDPRNTPVQADQSNGNQEREKRPPVVSSFSTSSKDLSPYPHKLQSGHGPPPVMHYGSQSNTPTLTDSPHGPLKRPLNEGRRSGSPEQAKNQRMTTHKEGTEDSDDEER